MHWVMVQLVGEWLDNMWSGGWSLSCILFFLLLVFLFPFVALLLECVFELWIVSLWIWNVFCWLIDCLHVDLCLIQSLCVVIVIVFSIECCLLLCVMHWHWHWECVTHCVVLCWLWMLLILSLLCWWLCDCALLCLWMLLLLLQLEWEWQWQWQCVCDCIVGVLWMFIGERCLQKASRKTATWGSSPSCGKRFVLFCLIVVFFLLLKGGERKRPCCMWPCMIVLIDSKRIWICNLICVSWTWFNQSTIVQGLCAQAPEDGLGDPWGMEFSHKALESNPDF